MRAARAHLPYLLGVTLFATAVIAPLPRVVRSVLAVIGLILLVTEGVVGLRGPVAERSADPRWPPALASRPRYRRALFAACVVIGVVGAGYLWAASLGDGLRGLKDASALAQSDSFPDANAAYIAALLAFAAGAFGAALMGVARRGRLLQWFLAIAAAGGVVFGISRLFI